MTLARVTLVLLLLPLGMAQGQSADVVTFLPHGDVFAPLLADPKQPEFLAGAGHLHSPIRHTMVGNAAFGENIGVARWVGAGRSIQVGLAGGVFAQFDLGSASIDLLNADYLIGLPVTYSRGPLSLRVRIYHQSSHLGDEYLLQARPERVNLSFESLELLLAAKVSSLRLYGGGEYIMRHEPRELASSILHGGAEYRPDRALFSSRTLGQARLVGGLDVKSSGEHDWLPAWSARVGLEFVPTTSTRRWSVLLSWYDGLSPYGQFYTQEIRYYGAGLHLAL
jgi:hypothetical protein